MLAGVKPNSEDEANPYNNPLAFPTRPEESPVIVVEPTENNPLRKPIVVEVELP